MNLLSVSNWVIWEDENWMALNKPPLIATLADRTSEINVLSRVRSVYPDAQVCHRLDKETSGVLLVAKNAAAYRHASLQFQHRQVEKVYHAVVHGQHHFKDLAVEIPLETRRGTVVRAVTRGGKKALTHFQTLKIYRQHTLVECRPVTGRTHQVRVHLAYAGAPIVGDLTYGGRPFFLSEIKSTFRIKKGEAEKPLMDRVALHAYSLVFSDLSGDRRTITAPYPKDFRAMIRQLEQN
jgi:23S rRNA pseudouridine955/2504/2580 synthase